MYSAGFIVLDPLFFVIFAGFIKKYADHEKSQAKLIKQAADGDMAAHLEKVGSECARVYFLVLLARYAAACVTLAVSQREATIWGGHV